MNSLVFLLTGVLNLLAETGVLMPQVAVRGIECTVVFDVPRMKRALGFCYGNGLAILLSPTPMGAGERTVELLLEWD